MKLIIVATDFSNSANNALKYTCALAASLKARILLYHFIENPLSPGSSSYTVKEKLVQLAKEATTAYGIQVSANTKVKSIVIGLEEAVEETKADMVVVGMHTSHWNDKVFGNTTTAILRSAKWPVLVVPEKSVYQNIQNILFASSTPHINGTHDLPLLHEFADHFKANVQVLHVVIKNNNLKKSELVSAVSAEQSLFNNYHVLEGEDVVTGIEKGIEQYDAQMLLMEPHRLNFLESILHQSVTRAMVLRTQIPLLALPCDYNYNNKG